MVTSPSSTVRFIMNRQSWQAFRMLYSAVRQHAKHGRQQISIAVRQSPTRARYAPAKHARNSWWLRYERSHLINVNRGIDKVQRLGHFEEKQDVYDLVHNRR